MRPLEGVMGSWNTAVITGSGSGLGRALALEAAARGASVVVSDLHRERIDETVALIEAAGGTAIGMPCDVRQPDEVDALLAAGLEAFGTVDLWVNNAGVAVSGKLEDTLVADWRWIIDINLMGVVHGCQTAVRHFRAQDKGHVLNVASAAGLVSGPGMAPYNATKAAVVALTESLYAELQGSGVGTTVLCPTFFETNLRDTARAADPKLLQLAEKLMKGAKVDAGWVAAKAISACERSHLYAVPMTDGKMMWWAKRVAPQWSSDVMRFVATKVIARAR